MGRQIELLPFLAGIVRTNTRAYQSDFDYDIRTLTRAVQEPNMENRTFYWMSRPSGTWCVRERDVFLRETDGHAIWTYYGDRPERIWACRVIVTAERDGSVLGKVFPLDYKEQVCRVLRDALPVATVTLTYPNGYVERMTYGEWERCRGQIHERYGPPDRIRYAPEDEGELTRRIMLEHRFQKGWNRKPRTRRTDAPCR